jgi:FMN phosphatase YigB (HAD superfamily)
VYPDASPCIGRLKAAGLKTGAAGNMSADVERFLASCGLDFDMIGSSQCWGVEKPDPRFFEHVIEAIGLPAD